MIVLVIWDKFKDKNIPKSLIRFMNSFLFSNSLNDNIFFILYILLIIFRIFVDKIVIYVKS
jgi:hypothetical protein